MLRIKIFTALQKMPNFQFLGPTIRPWWAKKSCFLARPENNLNQSKPILVIVSIKAFIHQSCRQNYFLREIEWAVFSEAAS